MFNILKIGCGNASRAKDETNSKRLKVGGLGCLLWQLQLRVT